MPKQLMGISLGVVKTTPPFPNGYNVQLDGDTAYGYSFGGAFEREDIALWIAVTYHSSIEHNIDIR